MSNKKYLNQDPHTVLKEVWGYESFRENQLEAITDILEGNKDVLFLARTGLGKALHKETLIPVYPKGFKTMLEIKVGDTVFSKDGIPTKVTHKFQPKINKHYKITFLNGEVIKCCKDHLWTLSDESVVNTDKLFNIFNKTKVVELVKKDFVKYPSIDITSNIINKSSWYSKGSISSLPDSFIYNSKNYVLEALEGILLESGYREGDLYIVKHPNINVLGVLKQLLSILGITYKFVSLFDFEHIILFESKKILCTTFKKNLSSYLKYLKEEENISLEVGSLDTIVDMEIIKDNKDDYYCIAVEDESKTFLITKSYIPTHNSLVFQLPALIKPGMALVISPLLALMSDQVVAANKKGIRACTINSTLTKKQKTEVLEGIKQGDYDICYIAPESLISITMLEFLKEYGNISFISIDESHCHPPETLVATDKGQIRLDKIEDYLQDSIKALSYNIETKKYEYKEILRVYKNENKEKLVKLSVKNGNKAPKYLISTASHEYHTKSGEYKQAKDLKVGSNLTSFKTYNYAFSPTKNQLSFIVGSILGDGGLDKRTETTMRIRFVHSKSQENYLRWKYSFLSYPHTPVRETVNQGFSDSLMYHFTSPVFEVKEAVESVKWGTQRTKLPQWVFDCFDEKSLAIWIMDDGSISDQLYSISCNSFSKEFAQTWSDFLNKKFKLTSRVGISRDKYPTLYFNKSSSIKIKELITPYVPSCMSYKLGQKDNPFYLDWQEKPEITTLYREVISTETLINTYDYMYDLEVADNNNYVIFSTDGQTPILVHNCTSQYGHDFRPDYQKVGGVLRAEFPNVPIIALTATADKVTKEDIIKTLKFDKEHTGFEFKTYTQDLDRPNIHYHVYERIGNGYKQLLNILSDVPKTEKVIIYCSTKNGCDEVSRFLNTQGFKARPYYSTVKKKDKEKFTQEFSEGKVQIMCCTSSFGMGVDEEVRVVVAIALPTTLEDTVQYFGRAGRSGEKAHAYLLFDKKKDVNFQKWLISQSVVNPSRKKVVLGKIEQVGTFASSKDCYRTQILKYFDQEYPKDSCGTCSNCIKKITL